MPPDPVLTHGRPRWVRSRPGCTPWSLSSSGAAQRWATPARPRTPSCSPTTAYRGAWPSCQPSYLRCALLVCGHPFLHARGHAWTPDALTALAAAHQAQASVSELQEWRVQATQQLDKAEEMQSKIWGRGAVVCVYVCVCVRERVRVCGVAVRGRGAVVCVCVWGGGGGGVRGIAVST